MAGRTVRFCACLIALGLGAPGAFAARVVDPATARLAIGNPVVVAQDAELAAFAASGSATELSAKLERIAHDAMLVDVAQEWLLDRGLHALARLEPTREARASAARLSLRAPVVYGIVDPEHGRRPTPLYDAGATARFVLRSWDRAAARRKAESELAAGSLAPVARFASRAAASATDPVREGIGEAFRAAVPAELAAQRAAIVDAIGAGRRVDELALVAAERLTDRALYDLVVDNADEPVALAAIAGATLWLRRFAGWRRARRPARSPRDFRSPWPRRRAPVRGPGLPFQDAHARVPARPALRSGRGVLPGYT